MTNPNCRVGEHEACDAILAYGECNCSCHAEELARMHRRTAADHMRQRAAMIRQANGIPHAGR